jgi:hypothetical protein
MEESGKGNRYGNCELTGTVLVVVENCFRALLVPVWGPVPQKRLRGGMLLKCDSYVKFSTQD